MNACNQKFNMRAKKFPAQITLIFKLFTRIHLADMQKAARLESDMTMDPILHVTTHYARLNIHYKNKQNIKRNNTTRIPLDHYISIHSS